MLARIAPSFSLLDAKHVAGIILRADGSGHNGGGTYDVLGPTGTSLGYPTVAARSGDQVVLFGVGFGPTFPGVPAGSTFSGAWPTTNSARILVGGVTSPAVVLEPSFSGLSSAGLYQVNIRIPAGLGSGELPINAIIRGAQAQTGVVIALQ